MEQLKANGQWIELAEYASELAQLGQGERALELCASAEKSAGKRPRRRLLPIYAARLLALISLGRHGQELVIDQKIVALAGSGAPQRQGVALLALKNGEAERAREIAQAILAAHPDNEEARLLIAAALRFAGKFEESLGMLVGGEGGVPAARLISAAETLLVEEKTEPALTALERAADRLGDSLAVLAIHRRLMAQALALRGESQAAEEALAGMWRIVEAHPRWKVSYEAPLAAGIVSLRLDRLEDAEQHLSMARNRALHPADRHLSNYWCARWAQAAGRADAAREYFQAVLDDNFGSWAEKMAS